MSLFSKVAWKDGLFMQPQHLQQPDRYLEKMGDVGAELKAHLEAMLALDNSRTLLVDLDNATVVAARQAFFAGGSPPLRSRSPQSPTHSRCPNCSNSNAQRAWIDG